MMQKKELAEILRKASEVIQEKGHCKGKLANEYGNVCMWGAIKTASVGVIAINDKEDYMKWEKIRGELLPIFRQSNHFSGSLISDYTWPGSLWNDKPETTSEDVQKFLLKTADEIEFQ
jgi:hypothetical protein